MRTSSPIRSLALAMCALSLTGCAGASVPMEPAPTAQAVECAYVTVALPDEVDGLPKRQTNAQATGAWGNPARILLRCGMPTPPPSSQGCLNVNGVDWLRDDSDAPTYRFTTYGREPAVEVTVDASEESGVSGTNALVDLGGAVSTIEQQRKCVGAEDLFDVPPQAPDQS